MRGGCGMKQAVPYFGRFLSKLFLEIIPGALVSVFAAYLLSMLHLGAEPATPVQSVAVPQNDGLSGDERRELTRQMLKERRENPEEPAEVKPLPSLRPAASPTDTADLHDHVAAPPAATESKLHAEPEAKPRADTRPALATISPPPTTPLPRAPAPRVKTEAAAAPALPPPLIAPAAPTVTASLPPAGAAPAGASPTGAPTALPQVTVNAPAVNAPAVTAPTNVPAGDLATGPQQRGIVGNIFSGVSTIAGGAANITGNTVNWVIDLPGKAISAGGKLLTGNGSTPAAAPGNTAAGNAAAGSATAAGNGSPANAAPATTPPTPLPMIDPQRRNFL
jgi:cell division protein FtsN